MKSDVTYYVSSRYVQLYSPAVWVMPCTRTRTRTHTHCKIMTPPNIGVLTHDKGFEAHKWFLTPLMSEHMLHTMLLCGTLGCERLLTHMTWKMVFCFMNAHMNNFRHIYRVSQEECARLRESVPYVKLYRYNPKHLYPKLNGYRDNGERNVWASGVST
jgi:hypothetical protein